MTAPRGATISPDLGEEKPRFCQGPRRTRSKSKPPRQQTFRLRQFSLSLIPPKILFGKKRTFNAVRPINSNKTHAILAWHKVSGDTPPSVVSSSAGRGVGARDARLERRRAATSPSTASHSCVSGPLPHSGGGERGYNERSLLPFMGKGRPGRGSTRMAGNVEGAPPAARHRPSAFRRRHYGAGMIRRMKPSNRGTVKAVSPCAGL